MPCGDFFHWLGCRLNLGCAGDPPLFTSWQVAGHVGSFVDNSLVVARDQQLALPWTCPRVKTLMSSAIHCISFPPDHSPCGVRAAIYRSRSASCGYPGALLMDLGLANVSTPGIQTFEGGDTGPLPSCELLWFMTWYQSGLHIGGLSDEAGTRGAAWPVLQFRNPGDPQPYVGWVGGSVWVSPDDADWPDPWPDGGQPLDHTGRVNGDPSPDGIVGLPALFCLFS